MYKLALTNVPFDNTYSNVVHAVSREQQYTMFNIGGLLSNKPEVNFKISDSIKTRAIIRVDSTDEVFGYNYLIAKDTSKSQYDGIWFYFITNITFDNDKQYIFDLELDVYQTYMPYIKFGQSFIKRAHLNRFKKINDKYTFINDIESPLYLEEDFKTNQMLATNKQIALNLAYNDTVSPPPYIQQWFKDNVKFWEIYIYDDNGTNGGYNLPIYGVGSDFIQARINLSRDFSIDYLCLVVPHYKNNSAYIYINHATKLFVMDDTIIKQHTLLPTANLVARVISPVCPISTSVFNDCDIDSNNRLILYSKPRPSTDNYLLFQDIGVLNSGIFKYSQPTGTYISDNVFSFLTDYDLSSPITIEDIQKLSNSIQLNPKLYLSNVRRFRITDGLNYKDYIPLAFTDFNITKVSALKSFSMSDIALYIYLYNIPDNNIYANSQENYEGLNSIQDGQMLFSRDQIDIFLANNKNFIAQAVTQQVGNFAKSAITGQPKAIAGGAISAAMSAADTYMTYDNIANSPDQIACSKLNVLQALNISNLLPIFKYYRATRYDMERINLYTHKYGYLCNIIDNPLLHLNTRKIFNYIEADIDSVYSDNKISNPVKNMLKNIFKNGVRVWANLNVYGNYRMQNYEVNI